MEQRPPQQNFEDIFENFGNIFSDFFGRTGARGADLHDELWVDLVDAAEGGTIAYSHPVTKARLKVSIPPGSDSGQVLRLADQGAPGKPPGHLYITLRVRAHRTLEREGPDIVYRAVIDPALARDGGSILVPSLHGPLEIEIPARTHSGDKLTLAGCGAVKLGCPAAPFPGRSDAPFRAADVSSHRGNQVVEFVVRNRLGPAVGVFLVLCVLGGVFYLLWP